MALCMIFGMFTNVATVDVQAAQKNVVTVRTQEQLDKALKSGKATKIKIVTDKKISLVINKGKKTTGVQIVANAPKATIVNKATFKKISITGSGAKSFTESGKNNVLMRWSRIHSMTMTGHSRNISIRNGMKTKDMLIKIMEE